MLDRITPLVLTYNEEANIHRLMESLSWARRVVVVDSGSSDATRAIVAGFANASCVVRPFDNHAGQWNYGLTATAIETEWVLALDADYGLPAAFIEELKRLDPPAEVAGLRAAFRYCIEGVALRGGLYPPVVVLFRRARARYRQDGHTQRVEVDGRIESFANPLLHDDRKPLAHWLWSQARYMRTESAKLMSMPFGSLDMADRLRRFIVVAPLAMFFYCYVLRGGVLEGKAGLFYALQRATAEAILSLYLVLAALERAAARVRDE